MGSYTDTPLTANSFRPYVQQMPVEAMTSVGLQKQNQYDQGYQRIQSQIDKVAGLSVMRDVDKTYLKSKMNELGNNLRMVSMGDFSNYQLVNSVGGMVNQVGSDPYIQSAVSSTARIHNELNTMDTLRKAGKSDKNNEAYFYDKVLNPYLNAGLKDENGKPVSFNGSFSPYVDVTSEVQKLAKDAGLDETVLQQMYATDANGKIQFDNNPKSSTYGQAIPARTMTQVENQSNAKALQGIINTVLSRGDVQNQMGIDAWANTRGVDPNVMLAGYKEDYNDKFHAIDDQAAKWNTLLAGKVSDEQKVELQNNLKQLADTKTEYQNQLKGLTALAQSNPEAFKQQIYQNNYKNSLRNMFLKTKRQEKNLESPLTKQMNWEQEFHLKQSSEMFDRGIALRQQAREDEKFKAEWIFDPITKTYTKNDGKNKPSSPDYGGRLSADNPGSYTKTAEERNTERLATLNKRSYDTGFELMYDIHRRSGFPTATSKGLFKKDIEKQAAKEGITPEQYVYKWIKELDINAKTRGVQLAPRDRELATKALKDGNDYLDQVAITKEINEDAEKNNGTDVNNYISSLVPASVTFQDGRSIGFTQRDMLDYALYDSDPKVKQRVDATYGNRTALLGHMYDVLRMKYGSNEYTISHSPEWQSLKAFQDLHAEKFKKAAEEREMKFKQIFPDDENIALNAGTTDAEIKATKQRVTDLVSNNSTLYGKDFDKQKILKALTEDGSRVSFVGSAPSVEGVNWKGEIVVIDKDGKDRHIVIDKQSDLEILADAKFKEFKYNNYLARARAGNTHSTNLGADVTDENANETARFSSDVLLTPQSNDSKYIFLGADLNLMADETRWTPVIYVKERSTGKKLNLHSDRTYLVGTEDMAVSDISNLTDPAFEKIVKDNNKR